MNTKINKSTEIEIVIPFHDLDPLQVVWHGNYLKYFDMARFDLFERLGVDLQEYYRKTNCIFPIIKTSTKYIIPLRHRDRIICKATLKDAQTKIIIDFEIRHAESGKICCKGTGEQAAVQLPETELLLKIPDDIRTALGF
jgi:acyl-CoA thioester hydrolase